jgi:hypothetical protein
MKGPLPPNQSSQDVYLIFCGSIDGVSAENIPANANQLRAITHSIDLDDARTEAILKAHLKLSEDVWANLWRHDLHWSAYDAVTVGVADAVADFARPFGTSIFTL